jgi:hypothetical protein
VAHKSIKIKLMKDLHAFEGMPQEALTHCTKCGKKIWKYWHIAREVKVPLADGAFMRKNEFPVMDKCAPCYFGYKNE